MDPLSLTAAVSSVCATSFKVTKTLYDFHGKYKQASLTIVSICSESSVIHAVLTQIRSLLDRDGDRIMDRLQQRSDLAATFDMAFTGCLLLYSCLDDEIGRLRTAVEGNGELNWKKKLKATWKEETFQSLMQQLRGQETALQLLLQSLQMESSSDVKRLLERNVEALHTIKNDTAFLRTRYPGSNVPESILETRKAESLFADNASVLSTTEFSFDDEIVQARAYRRVLQLAQAKIARQPEKEVAKDAESPEDIHDRFAQSLISEDEDSDERHDAFSLELEEVKIQKVGNDSPTPSLPQEYENYWDVSYWDEADSTIYARSEREPPTEYSPPHKPLITAEINRLKSQSERIAAYDRNRHFWANYDHGLKGWLASAVAAQTLPSVPAET